MAVPLALVFSDKRTAAMYRVLTTSKRFPKGERPQAEVS